MEPPAVGIGTREEYELLNDRARSLLRAEGISPDQLERVDARFNYRSNRITLFHLQDSCDATSVADTISHELLHALLDQAGERHAARLIDLVCRPVGDPDRRGGL